MENNTRIRVAESLVITTNACDEKCVMILKNNTSHPSRKIPYSGTSTSVKLFIACTTFPCPRDAPNGHRHDSVSNQANALALWKTQSTKTK